MARAWWANVGAGALLSATLVGCSFDSNTGGSGGELGGTESDGSGSTTTMSGTASTATSPTSASDPSDPTGTSDPATTDPSDATDTDDPPADVAVLELSEGADFGLVAIDGA